MQYTYILKAKGKSSKKLQTKQIKVTITFANVKTNVYRTSQPSVQLKLQFPTYFYYKMRQKSYPKIVSSHVIKDHILCTHV